LQAWSDARFEWLLAHPDGTIDRLDAVDVIYELEEVGGTEHCA
jgi:hypothetical protein